ncbi:MAG: hypothetical protein VX730_08565 [Pseudomonadota bacterium]|nr:hypothetical protein [Pseudomonadota bacterium]
MPTPAEIERNRRNRGYVTSTELCLDRRTFTLFIQGGPARPRTFELKNMERLDFKADASGGNTQQELKVTFRKNGIRTSETYILDDYATLTRIYEYMAGLSYFHKVAVRLSAVRR